MNFLKKKYVKIFMKKKNKVIKQLKIMNQILEYPLLMVNVMKDILLEMEKFVLNVMIIL